MRSLSLTSLCLCTLSVVSFAGPTLPCTAGKASETVLPVKNNFQAYCVSDFGWSDTWFGTMSPATYIQDKDILSGDDAPFINYMINGNPGHGNGILSPSLDNGTLDSTLIGSNWAILTPLAYVGGFGTTKTQSVIREPVDLVQITITTQVTNYTVTLTLDILNNSANAITNLQIGDYFNLHPNGSSDTTTDPQKGTTRYLSGGTILVTGPHDSAWVADGLMHGSAVDNAHHIGTVASTRTAITTNTFNGSNGPFGPADGASALEWNLGTLNPGQSTSFTITKMSLPEPGTWGLLMLGVLAIAAKRGFGRP
jgi:hypothetical protein